MFYVHPDCEEQKRPTYQEKAGPGKEGPFIAQLSHSPVTTRQPTKETRSLQGARKTKSTDKGTGADKEHTSCYFIL